MTSFRGSGIEGVWWPALAALGLAAVLALPAWTRREHEEWLEYEPGATPVAQSTSTRTFHTREWHEVSRVGAAQGLHRPAYLTAAPHDGAFVLDSRDYSILTLAPNGAVTRVRAIPDPALEQASVPLTDLFVAPDDRAWFCGPTGRLVGLGNDRETRLLPRAYKVGMAGTAIVVADAPQQAQLLSLYDEHGTRLAGVAPILREQAKYKLALDGELASDPDHGRVFYAPYFGGFLASYDAKGRQLYVVATIDNAPLPRLTRMSNGGIKAPRAQSSGPRLLDLSARDDRLYALVELPGEGSPGRVVVDAYRAADGAYVESFRLPRPCRELIMGASTTYATCGEVVVVWRRSDPPRDGSDAALGSDRAPARPA